jgi:hypothetical protein
MVDRCTAVAAAVAQYTARVLLTVGPQQQAHYLCWSLTYALHIHNDETWGYTASTAEPIHITPHIVAHWNYTYNAHVVSST